MTGGKQSQLLVLGLSLEFDKNLGVPKISVFADFGGVLLVVLVILVTWVIWTSHPLNSANS